MVVCCEFTTNGAYWNQDDLKSLACLPKLRALISNRKLTEETEVELLSLCGEMIEWLSFSNLDHLWLNDGDWDRGEYLPPRVESLYLFDTYDLDHKRFQQLKRIGWCELDKTVKFPNAIYVSGLVQNVEVRTSGSTTSASDSILNGPSFLGHVGLRGSSPATRVASGLLAGRRL